MASNTDDLLKMLMGALVTQTAICEALIEKGVIDRASLIEKLGEKILSAKSDELATFAPLYVGAVLSGRAPPAAPASLH